MSASKNIVITGATSGLGRALTLAFAETGHAIWGCGRSTSAIEELKKIAPETVSLSNIDVTRADEVATWASEIISQRKGIDLLINNAGIINAPATLWKIPREEFDAVIDVNVKGVANVIREFIPSMLECRRGVIVNFVSGSGRKCLTDSGAYNASKWAVEALTKTLAKEIPEEMAAISLEPGTIASGMLEKIIGGRAASYEGAEQWARRAAPFILQLDNHSNGQTLSVPQA